MRCPFCSCTDDRVIDSRSTVEASAIRRRRECRQCGRRFTTYERVEENPRLVIKKDQRREPFNRAKVLQGLLKACEKRPVALPQLEALVDRVERRIGEEFELEVESHVIGQMMADQLKEIDQVAFVRFASVYQEFTDVTEFLRELKPLLEAARVTTEGAIPSEMAPLAEKTVVPERKRDALVEPEEGADPQ